MKLLLIPIIGVAVASLSCRTATPLDPNTSKPSERCLPENMQPGGIDPAK